MNMVRAAWCCLLWLGLAHAGEIASVEAGAAQLDRFMNGLSSMQGRFVQTVRDSKEQVIEQTSGTLVIKKPGKFHWEYAAPNAQTIVSDGARIWLFDPELEQVTIRKLDTSINGTPAVLLSGQGSWRDSFEVEHIEQRGGLTVINLAPKKTDSDFRRVQLALKGDDLTAMALTDKLGQSTLLEFQQFQRNARVSDAQFRFTPPKGTDVIDNSGVR